MYPARGDLQFYVDSIRPDGLGALQQAFEELKAKLAAEGLFDEGRKRPLPQFPAKIAVITSPEAAALQDILNILGRRYPLGEVVLIPTLVQGAEAAGRIAKAFSALARMSDIDVAIVARGGGSLEDLWPFNEEVVARAIFACGVPVISAVGHETDFTIADFVADLRAPTPSAAAELVAPDVRDLRLDLRETAEGMSRSMSRMLRDLRTSVELASDRLSSRAPDLRSERRRVDEILARARFATERLVESKRAGLKTLQAQVSALGPEQILNRGYAIVRLAGGTVLVDAGEARVGDGLEVMLAKGRLEAETTRVELDRGS
jgi:exodeoxyribonuclease VII large subunit